LADGLTVLEHPQALDHPRPQGEAHSPWRERRRDRAELMYWNTLKSVFDFVQGYSR